MRQGALRLTTLALLVLCLACSQPNNPTAPSLAGLGSLSGEAKGGNGGGNGGGGNGGGNPGGGGTFTFDLTGDIISSDSITSNGGTTNFHDPPNDVITLDVSFLAGAGGDFGACFSDVGAVGPGVIIVSPEDAEDGEAGSVLLTFAGWNTSGAAGGVEIVYELTADGTATNKLFPDATTDPDGILGLTGWSVTNRAKKDGKKSPCEGTGGFTIATTLTVTRIE